MATFTAETRADLIVNFYGQKDSVSPLRGATTVRDIWKYLSERAPDADIWDADNAFVMPLEDVGVMTALIPGSLDDVGSLADFVAWLNDPANA